MPASTTNAPAVMAPAPVEPRRKPECEQCVLEDLRQAAHRDQITVTGRYLGLGGRWLDGRLTRQPCTLEDDVIGVVAFEIIGRTPWPARPSRVETSLPCPELSRLEYAKLYHYDPDDRERDGLGHAPVLRSGHRYRLAFVRSAMVPTNEPTSPVHRGFTRALVAVDPPQSP